MFASGSTLLRNWQEFLSVLAIQSEILLATSRAPAKPLERRSAVAARCRGSGCLHAYRTHERRAHGLPSSARARGLPIYHDRARLVWLRRPRGATCIAHAAVNQRFDAPGLT